MSSIISLEQRLATLEHARLRDRRIGAAALVTLVAGLVASAASKQDKEAISDRVVARQVVIVDDAGRRRIVLGEDPKDTQRRSRGCGLNLYDTQGAERFGVSTMEDSSVTMGFDAPIGVGAPMRDRIGLVVAPDGSARIDLIDNRTMLPVRLVSEADGRGGVEFFEYDLAKNEVAVTRLDAKGSSKRVLPLGDGK